MGLASARIAAARGMDDILGAMQMWLLDGRRSERWVAGAGER